MRYTSKYAVEYDLEQHYSLRSRYQEKCRELSEFKGYRIKAVKQRKGRSFYSVKKPGESCFTYAGDANNNDIQAIKEYRFYSKMLEVIETNIKAMEDFLGVYRQTRAESINELLPRIYQLPKGDSLLKLEPEIDQWLRERMDIKKRNLVLNPAGLTCTAFDGTLMRSRAECIHYEAFYIYNVPCIFEFPYEVGGDVLSPDFTALDVYKMDSAIFEHLGNWFHKDVIKRRQYRTESIDRWDQLGHIGFFPEVNLFLTFGAGESHFDAQAIHRKVSLLASPPPSAETIEALRRL